MRVVKKNGSLEKLDISKISKSIEWACKDLKVNPSDIEVNLKLHLYDGIKTKDINSKVIKTIVDMSSLRYIDCDKVATRLSILEIYKDVYKSNTPNNFISTLKQFVDEGKYNKWLVYQFTDDELYRLSTFIDYTRNFNLSYIGLSYLKSKYMITDTIEDPQVMFMAISMDMFRDLQSEDRLIYIKDMYEALSTFKISLPSPMMRALRTNNTDYASCVALRAGDSIDSWTQVFDSLVKHTVASAGIGIDISEIASIGDKVKNGQITHAGKIPLLKAIDALIQTSTQNGRRGQAVAYINIFDPEIETILALKSPRTDVAKRINDLKYAIKTNELFYQRFLEGKDITLISVRQYPELQKLFNSNDILNFTRLYETIERENPDLPKISAERLFTTLVTERFENGVYYLFNVDEANEDTPYYESISQSNICMEFISPTKPVTEYSKKWNKPNIGICILGNINQGTVEEKDLEHYTKLLVYGLNNIIHRQEHPRAEANAFVRDYASLGIGFMNHAYWLAKNNWKYGNKDALIALDRWMEGFQYYLIKASMEYAKEFDAVCNKFEETKYSRGLMPFNRTSYNKNKSLCYDWGSLIKNVKEYGMANAALSMIPPSETSSVISNSTSGLEPIRDLVTVKGSKTNPISQFAPEALKLADKYDNAFRKNITKDFLHHIAIVQSWIDQGISTNTFYNPELYEDNKVPIEEVLEDIFLAKKLHIKTLYYNNTYVKDTAMLDDACAGGGCSV